MVLAQVHALFPGQVFRYHGSEFRDSSVGHVPEREGLLCAPLFRGLRSGITLMSPDLLPPIVYNLEPRIAPWSVVLSLVISLGTGVIFGLYPARKAALMNPVEALRHE